MRILSLITAILYLAVMAPAYAALPAMKQDACDAFKQQLQAKPNGPPDLSSPDKKPFVPTPDANAKNGLDYNDPYIQKIKNCIGHSNGAEGDKNMQKIIQGNTQNTNAGGTDAQFNSTSGIHANDEHSQLQRQANQIGSLGNLNTADGVKPPPMPN